MAEGRGSGRIIEVTPAVHINIRYADRKDRLVSEFYDWMMDNEVYPIRGTGASSPPLRFGDKWVDGQWTGVFAEQDGEAAAAWLEGQEEGE